MDIRFTLNACGCLPGTPENGWLETRSPACVEAERRQWAVIFDQLPNIIDTIIKELDA